MPLRIPQHSLIVELIELKDGSLEMVSDHRYDRYQMHAYRSASISINQLGDQVRSDRKHTPRIPAVCRGG